MKQPTTSGSARAAAVSRTQRLRHTAATRILRRATSGFLDRDNPVPPEVERELLAETVDERRSVLVQERDETNCTLLSVSAGKGECACVHELAPKCLVAPLGGRDHLAVQRLEVVLHSGLRRPCGAFERRIERRKGLNHASH